MKQLFLCLACLLVIPAANGQSKPDSLMTVFYRVIDNDSLFEAFVNSNRRRVYSHPQETNRLYNKIAEKAIEKEMPALAAVAFDVQGIFFQNTGIFDSAELMYRRSLAIRQSLTRPTLVAQSYNNLGVLHRRRGLYDSALHYFVKAFDLAETATDSILVGDYLSNIGLVYQNQGSFENAIQYNLRALVIRKATRDTVKIAASYNNLGIIYNSLKNYEEAATYLKESLAMKRAVGELRPIANTLVNLGSTFYYQGAYSKTTECLTEALSIFESLGDRQHSAATLENLSFVAKKNGNPLSAHEYLIRALEIRRYLGHQGDIISSLVNSATLLTELGRIKEAATHLDEAYTRAQEYGEIEPLKSVAQAKAYLYEKKGDYREAYRFHLQYTALKDSLLNENMLSRIAEMREKYETAEKEREIQFQESRLAQQAVVIAQRSQQRNFLIVIAAAILIILMLVYFSYRARLRAREALNQKTLEMERMRSQFFANISHEFRTPLTLIQSVADELSEKDIDPNTIQTVRTNSNRLLNLVDQLLDLSRLDAGQLKITAHQGDIAEFIRAISGAFSSLSAQKKIQYTVDVEDRVDGYFDADKLEKIIVNLLSNAFKFTPEDGVVELRAWTENDILRLTVTDTGPGIPDGEEKRIFDRFYQVSGNHHYGTGIGLSLTRELVELQGGAIEVKRLATGSCFEVTLPITAEALGKRGALIQSDESPVEYDIHIVEETDESGTPVETVRGSDKPTVLVVEDNADLRKYVGQILSRDYHVVEARNGEEGFVFAQKTVPDLIVSDIMMPGMDGVELCERLKTSVTTSHIPVILLTAKASEEDKLQGLNTGADDYLVKPFSKKELGTRIQNLIRQREKLIAKFSRSLNPREIKLNSADEAFMTRFRDIIEAHLDNSEFSVNQLSQEIGISRTQLFRKIQALTGFSASEFIRVVRLNHAAEMLKNKVGSVSEIAYRVGFNNLSYFTKCFKARFGSTPGNFT